MIRIKFKKKRNEIILFEIEGHANYAPTGQDIVCAAVSAVSEMAINGLKDTVGCDSNLELLNGYIYCDISDESPDKRQQAQTIMGSLHGYLENLCIQYPENVSVKIKDLDEVVSF